MNLASILSLAENIGLAPLLALDVVANMLFCGGTWRNTMSSRAWEHRNNHEWGWCCDFVDALFGEGHCKGAFEREQKFGTTWAAWRSDVAAALAGI